MKTSARHQNCIYYSLPINLLYLTVYIWHDDWTSITINLKVFTYFTGVLHLSALTGMVYWKISLIFLKEILKLLSAWGRPPRMRPGLVVRWMLPPESRRTRGRHRGGTGAAVSWCDPWPRCRHSTVQDLQADWWVGVFTSLRAPSAHTNRAWPESWVGGGGEVSCARRMGT